MEMISKERPATPEPAGIIFREIVASLNKVLKRTKILNKKEQLL